MELEYFHDAHARFVERVVEGILKNIFTLVTGEQTSVNSRITKSVHVSCQILETFAQGANTHPVGLMIFATG